MDVQKYILVISENEDILDDETKQQHYENIIMFNAELELYEDAVKRYNDTVNRYNSRVEVQEFLDSLKFWQFKRNYTVPLFCRINTPHNERR